MNRFTFLKVYNSPFKPFLPKLYIGRVAIGVPYFYPRKKVGFNFVGLGYKTKWSDTDYRFEWNPIWSFVFYRWQIALIFEPIECDHYWEAWLYYTYNTKGTQKERIEECKKEFPLNFKVSGIKDGEKYNYSYDAYDRILKIKEMDRQEKCKCKKPKIQPQTKQCGNCKLYIDRARHILLTNPNVVKSLPQDIACSKDRNKCSCKDWGGCPVDYPF